MKKLLVFSLAIALLFSLNLACKKKPVEVAPTPPQVVEQPPVEEVAPPVVKEPVLTEEEILLRKSLEEINREKPLSMIHFDFDRSFIRDDARPVLEANAAWLSRFPTIKILIEGHCDERGTEEYNLALGERRAKSTQDYLLSLGVAPERIRIISYGKSQPLDPRSNETAWQLNRRAQFLIIEK